MEVSNRLAFHTAYRDLVGIRARLRCCSLQAVSLQRWNSSHVVNVSSKVERRDFENELRCLKPSSANLPARTVKYRVVLAGPHVIHLQ